MFRSTRTKWFDCMVIWGEYEYIFDAIRGTDSRNALINAQHNWPDAKEIYILADYM
jgi:hypothetical protein